MYVYMYVCLYAWAYPEKNSGVLRFRRFYNEFYNIFLVVDFIQ